MSTLKYLEMLRTDHKSKCEEFLESNKRVKLDPSDMEALAVREKSALQLSHVIEEVVSPPEWPAEIKNIATIESDETRGRITLFRDAIVGIGGLAWTGNFVSDHQDEFTFTWEAPEPSRVPYYIAIAHAYGYKPSNKGNTDDLNFERDTSRQGSFAYKYAERREFIIKCTIDYWRKLLYSGTHIIYVTDEYKDDIIKAVNADGMTLVPNGNPVSRNGTTYRRVHLTRDVCQVARYIAVQLCDDVMLEELEKL